MKNILLLTTLLVISLLPPNFCAAQIVPAPTEKQAQSIDKLMAPHRAKIKAIVDADKTGKYEAYKADVKALFEEQDLGRRAELSAKMEREHYAFIKGLFAAAKIDLAELKRQITSVLGHSKFTMDEFGGISSATSLPPGAAPLNATAEFKCPMGAQDDETNCTLINSKCNSVVTDCEIDIDAIAVAAGGSRSKGSLGDKFSFPSGSFSKMTVSSQSNVYYIGGGEALILGYSQFNVRLGVRLQAPGLDKLTITRDEWCIAPLLWYKEISFNSDNYLMQATFTGNFTNGTTYTAQAYAEVFGLAVGAASGGGQCRLYSFDFVKAKASN